MKKYIHIVVVLLAMSGHAISSEELVLPDEIISQDDLGKKAVIVLDPNGRKYFPDKFDNWYREHLLAMGEPSLFFLKTQAMMNNSAFYVFTPFQSQFVFGASRGQADFSFV